MSDDLITALRSLDPAPAARTEGAARSAWGEATLRRITAATPARRRARWRAPAVAATGALALVALFLVLVTVTGGSGDDDQPASRGETAVVEGVGRPGPATLDALAEAIRRRAAALGDDDVVVERGPGTVLVTQRTPDESRLDDLVRQGSLWVRDPFRDDTEVQLPVRDARVIDGATVGIALTPYGGRIFTRFTRRWAATAAARGEETVPLVITIDQAVLSTSTLDVGDYPQGLEGSGGLQIPTSDATRIAAILSTPLPVAVTTTATTRG